MQLFSFFAVTHKRNKEIKDKNEMKEKIEENNISRKKNINNKYASTFLFSTFKLIEKVKNNFLINIFLFNS